MAKRPTPIERLLAGDSTDRQVRYQRNLARRGLTRLSLTVPASKADELRALVLRWRREHESGRDD